MPRRASVAASLDFVFGEPCEGCEASTRPGERLHRVHTLHDAVAAFDLLAGLSPAVLAWLFCKAFKVRCGDGTVRNAR